MGSVEIFSVASSIFSVALALFAIWFAVLQRKESQEAYEKTKGVLSELHSVMDKTQLLVSDNFQNLLGSITNQQAQMLEALKPRPTQEAMYAELIVKLASEDPEKLDKVANVISRFQKVQPQSPQPGGELAALLQLAQLGNKLQKPAGAT